MGSMSGKVALVTGAASGIGLAILERFVAEGGQVMAADIQDDKGAALAARFPDAVRYVRCDVTDVAAIAAAVEATTAAFGGLDVMVNNAGAGGTAAAVEDIETGGFDHTVRLLLRSVVFGTRYAVPALRARGGGSVINTASVAGLMAGGTPFTYSVCKAAVIHYTRCAALELAADKIRVNVLCPGVIATPIWGGFRPDATPEMAQQMAGMMAQLGPMLQPLPKAGLPEDIAAAALYLATAESAFVTGHALVVDGGITVSRTPHDKMGFAKALGVDPNEAEAAYRAALAAEKARWPS